MKIRVKRMLIHEKILVLGSRGLVGSAILTKLKELGYVNLLSPTRLELDLLNHNKVMDYFSHYKPDYVILAAAKVGGILANKLQPADFIYQNIVIQTNVIEAAYRHNIKKLLFLGSSCIYPKFAPQPIKEDYLLSGPLEPTNEPYALAKISGIKMCNAYNQQYNTNFLCIMPTNLYGPRDQFDPKHSHVVPALIRRFYEAKKQHEKVVKVWGTGKPKREFMYVDDLADASIFLLKNYNSEDISPFVNIGVGEDISIKGLAYMIKRMVGFNGEIEFDLTKPDGTPRKLLDISRMNALGWKAKTSLEEGLFQTYEWFKGNHKL